MLGTEWLRGHHSQNPLSCPFFYVIASFLITLARDLLVGLLVWAEFDWGGAVVVGLPASVDTSWHRPTRPLYGTHGPTHPDSRPVLSIHTPLRPLIPPIFPLHLTIRHLHPSSSPMPPSTACTLLCVIKPRMLSIISLPLNHLLYECLAILLQLCIDLQHVPCSVWTVSSS